VEGVEQQRQIPMAKLASPLFVPDADGRQLLEQLGDVVDLEV
jgi:hypothetical protein